ncbi:indolepyruvate decarboxylase [Brenneria alni]|uniref:Indolepyruvate decarboxylase n=1 Tax=Brenneria alni TaxID=71656 RepID=A0A421DP90_9GAMM|nr:thiamine pyrophosphate-binding protein [Brenneria alni]RLM24218.1 indolepyruvate decarboxylase [Brenneria alni]
MLNSYTIGDYLLDRLAQTGIKHLFGVPGDYNLQFLDHVINHDHITWVGCANELNAAYAADGYARCKPAAALLTTFGVGELSAINGIAGSYAEYVPVIHITFAPNLISQHKRQLLHHTLGDGDFGHFLRMAMEVTVASATLTIENATSEIDRVVGDALRLHRPVYLFLPLDVAAAPTGNRPYPLPIPEPVCSDASLQAFVDAATEILSAANSVSLLADFLAERFGAAKSLQRWLDQTSFPHSTLLMGKSTLNEQHPCFTGTYAGNGSDEKIRSLIEDAEVIISVGVLFTDTTTAGFSHHIPTEKCIDIQPAVARVGDKTFSNIPMLTAIETLEKITSTLSSHWKHTTITPPALPSSYAKDELDQHGFWQQIQGFLRPGDLIVAEQGTACFGAAALTLLQGCRFITQSLWGTIGYTLPAAYGAQLAEPLRRVILLIGDGSLQLTAQEIGSMLRDNLNIVIFVLNNQGYTVERAIHNPQQRYHDIAPWNWTQLPIALGGDSNKIRTRKTSSPAQLAQALDQIGSEPCFSLIDVVLPKMDIPELLQAVSQSLEQNNSAH